VDAEGSAELANTIGEILARRLSPILLTSSAEDVTSAREYRKIKKR
jgi:hypothetical protein